MEGDNGQAVIAQPGPVAANPVVVAQIDTEPPEPIIVDNIDVNDQLTQANKVQLKELVRSRGTNRGQITKMINGHTTKVQTLAGDALIEHLDCLTQRLTMRFEEVRKLDHQIVALLPEDRRDADCDTQYDYEEKILSALQRIETARKAYHKSQAPPPVTQVAAPQQDHTPSISKMLNLPKVNIPILPKDITKFLAWHDQFNSTIHDVSHISDVLKLTYLRQACAPNHASIIEHIPTEAGDNYSRARAAIYDRLYNPRVIAFSLISQFMTSPQVKPDNGPSLLRLGEMIRGMLADLKKVGVKCENWDVILMQIVMEKMDDNTKREYMTSFPSKDLPELEHCIKFMDERGLALTSLFSKATNEDTNKSKKQNNNQNNQSSLMTKQIAATASLAAAVQSLNDKGSKPQHQSQGRQGEGEEDRKLRTIGKNRRRRNAPIAMALTGQTSVRRSSR